MQETSNEVKNEVNEAGNEAAENNVDELEEAVKNALDKQYRAGMIVGMATIAKVIMNTMNNKKKTLPGNFSDVRRICLTAINAVKKVEKDGGEQE